MQFQLGNVLRPASILATSAGDAAPWAGFGKGDGGRRVGLLKIDLSCFEGTRFVVVVKESQRETTL